MCQESLQILFEVSQRDTVHDRHFPAFELMLCIIIHCIYYKRKTQCQVEKHRIITY
jgi:hypothetical protein